MSNIVYKALCVEYDGYMVSINGAAEMTIQYNVGDTILPTVGGLFVFDSVASAQKYGVGDALCRCEAYDIKSTPPFILAVGSLYDNEVVSLYWDAISKGEDAAIDEIRVVLDNLGVRFVDTPSGTIICGSLRVIECIHSGPNIRLFRGE